jgi:hypothetical protein
MKIYYLLFLLFTFCQLENNAQRKITIRINTIESIQRIAKERGDTIFALVSTAIGSNASTNKLLKEYFFSLEQQYFLAMQHEVYLNKQLVLKEKAKLKRMRFDLLKGLLTEKEFSIFLTLQAQAEKSELAKLKINTSNPSVEEKAIMLGLGWDLLGQEIIYSNK